MSCHFTNFEVTFPEGLLDEAPGVLTSWNENIMNWDVSSVTNFSVSFIGTLLLFYGVCRSWLQLVQGAFFLAAKFSIDLSVWDVSNAVDMSGMFWMAQSFNANIGSWNVGKVGDMNSM